VRSRTIFSRSEEKSVQEKSGAEKVTITGPKFKPSEEVGSPRENRGKNSGGHDTGATGERYCLRPGLPKGGIFIKERNQGKREAAESGSC